MANKQTRSDGQVLRKRPRAGAGSTQSSRASSGSPFGKSPTPTALKEQTKLRARLKDAEETLRAIRSGEVDALMVSGRSGERIVSLKGGEPNYRLLVEAMSEGAATLSRKGIVLYCNRRFAVLMNRPPGKIVGIEMRSLVAEPERSRFKTLLTQSWKTVAKGEFNLLHANGRPISVYLSLNRLRGFKGEALGMVITDLSEQKSRQAEEGKRAELTRRLILERTLSAQEDERRRFARELHDEAGQLLTALLVGLRTLEDFRKLVDAKAQGRRLRVITAQAIDEVGRLARGLHPTVLDDHGLGVALSRYAAEYAKAHKIAVDLKLGDNESDNLSSAVQITLYRIIQEALTNVARHSGAKSVSIRFVKSAKTIAVEINDDGCGFDADAVAVSSHRLGIQSMRERAAMLGGTVSFVSQHKGTRMLVHVPLANRTSSL
jgi:PAS domain S-box-containing protein